LTSFLIERKQVTGARRFLIPAINVKPVVGGGEIAVRYITRANERYQLRAKLYHAAVDLPGEKNAAHVGAPVGAATKMTLVLRCGNAVLLSSFSCAPIT